jgi:Na+/melibiose symporter-like transporter
VLGLDPKLSGLALLIALVFDAISDPLVGYLSDSWRSRLGRRHPFLFASIVPLALCFYLLFSPPALSETGLFLWLTTFAVLTRTSITLFYVPHAALGGELSDDFHERTTVVQWRYSFSYLGYLCAYGVGFGYFFADTPAFPQGGHYNLDGYSPFAMVMSLLMVAAIAIASFGTLHRLPYLRRPAEVQQLAAITQVPITLFREMGQALRNRSFAWMFAGILTVFVMVGVDSALNLYMNTYYWSLGSGENFWFFSATVFGVLLGAVFTRRLNERFDKLPCVMVGTAGWAAGQIVPVLMRQLGWFPDNDTDALYAALVGMRFLQGLFVIQALVTFNSMVPDIVDEHELRTGKRQEGIFFAASSFSQKATQGLGTFLAGVALTLIGWPEGGSEAEVTEANIRHLGLLFGPLLAGFAAICLFCYTKYDLTRERHREIVVALAARRLQAEADASAAAAAGAPALVGEVAGIVPVPPKH